MYWCDDIKKNKVEKIFFTYVLETILYEVGSKELLDSVLNILQNKFNCNITDCYLHPRYFKYVLEILKEKQRRIIIDSLIMNLKDFDNQRSINFFIKTIHHDTSGAN